MEDGSKLLSPSPLMNANTTTRSSASTHAQWTTQSTLPSTSPSTSSSSLSASECSYFRSNLADSRRVFIKLRGDRTLTGTLHVGVAGEGGAKAAEMGAMVEEMTEKRGKERELGAQLVSAATS
jgi:hypothetical protein